MPPPSPLGHNIDSYIRPPFVGSDVCLKTCYILSFFIRSFLPFITNLLRRIIKKNRFLITQSSDRQWTVSQFSDMSGEFKSADRSYQTSKGDPTAKVLAPVVQTLDCTIHSINQHYPHFDQLGPRLEICLCAQGWVVDR